MLNNGTMSKTQMLHQHLRQNVNNYRGKTQVEMAELAGKALRLNIHSSEVSALVRSREDLMRLRSERGREVSAQLAAAREKARKEFGEPSVDNPTPSSEKPKSIMGQLADLTAKCESVEKEFIALKERMAKMEELLGVTA